MKKTLMLLCLGVFSLSMMSCDQQMQKKEDQKKEDGQKPQQRGSKSYSRR